MHQRHVDVEVTFDVCFISCIYNRTHNEQDRASIEVASQPSPYLPARVADGGASSSGV